MFSDWKAGIIALNQSVSDASEQWLSLLLQIQFQTIVKEQCNAMDYVNLKAKGECVKDQACFRVFSAFKHIGTAFSAPVWPPRC